MTRRRHARIAALLSLVLPGLGHLYAGYPVAAVVAYAATLLSGAVIVAVFLSIPNAPTRILVGLLFVSAAAALVIRFAAIPIHAAILARRQPATFDPRPYNRWYVYVGLYVGIGAVLEPIVWEQVWDHVKLRAQAVRVPSGSMEPTLLIGDYLFADKTPSARKDVANGSLVLFESTEEPGLQVIKRVVGTPGDTLMMTADTLRRNGLELTEPYVSHRDPARSENPVQRAKMRAWQVSHTVSSDTSSYTPDVQRWGPIVVPPDSVFVLGDNRDSSYDSRYYGFIPLADILGQPRVVYFSIALDSTGGLRGVRWSRIGQQVSGNQPGDLLKSSSRPKRTS